MDDYENAIEISGLVKRFDGFTLDNVNLNVPKGSIMGFVGQNGAGKTTTIRSLIGTLIPDEGSIKMFGMELNEHESEIRERIAVVFDELPFHDTINAKQLDIILKDIFRNWDSLTFFEYLRKFQIPVKKKFSTFSKGMKMKLQIASALSHKAELLIMDEATSGLDPVVRSEMLDVFMEFIQDEGHSILMSSHISSDLERVADSLTFIHEGKIILTGYKDEILENHLILKCSEKDIASVDSNDIVSIRISDFGCEVMVRNVSKKINQYSSFISEKAALDQILLFYVRGKNAKEWSI